MRTSVWLMSFVFSLAAAIAGQPADDDFEVNGPLEQEFQNLVPPVDIHAFRGGSQDAAVRQQLDALLEQRIREVDRICRLTHAQKKKLHLAGAGDSKRFLDRVERIVAHVQLVRNDPVKVQELVSEIAQLNRRYLKPDLSDEGSLLVKCLKSTLTDDQFARYQQLQSVVLAGGLIQTRQGGPDEVVDVTLSGTVFADEALARLSNLPGLHSLLLNGTQVTDVGLAHLDGRTRLAVLRLDDTQVTDAGLAHLVGMSGLRELCLDNTRVTDAGLAHLKGMVELEWLSLANTRVTDGGLVHLQDMTSLKYLDLDRTPVTDAGLVHLKRLTRLQHLDLAEAPVTDAGLVHLAALTGLQGLNLQGTLVTSAGFQHLQGLPCLQELGFIDPQTQPVQSRTDQPARSAKLAADPMPGERPGQVRDDNGLKIKLVWCPGGFLKMANGAKPVGDHAVAEIPLADAKQAEKGTSVKVFLSQGYWLGKYEITQGEWKQLMRTTPWNAQSTAPDTAATFITWPQAIEFCRTLTAQERKAGRLPDGWEYTLPTEAQWERACRAGTATQYSFGDDDSNLDEYAWFQTNAQQANESYPHPVGQKKPNPWGLYDMHGNVREWCLDVFVEKLPGGRDPEVTTGGQNRVIRGGNYFLPASSCRSSSRDSSVPNGSIAFRLALCPVRQDATPTRNHE